MRTLSFVRRLTLMGALALALTGCGKEEKKKSDNATVTGEHRWDVFPVSLQVDEALLDRGWGEDDLRQAIKFWEKKAGRPLFSLGSWRTGISPYTGRADNPADITANVIFFQSPWPHETRVAGKTFLFVEGDKIRKAGIFLNAHTDLCHGYCVEEPYRTSRRKLLAHELGHFLGLGHVDSDPDNIMYPEIRPGGALEGLTVDEKAFLRLIQ